MTPEEAERQAAEGQPEEEVRPEEFTQGIGAPVWVSPLPAEVVDELRKPLNPNRVRRRKGRGGGQFEYLAGHDAKRRANELFGFGNWGYQTLKLEETAAVEVESVKYDQGGAVVSRTPGWHVSYTALVQVDVRGCLPFSDCGYGDGVEYGPAALATARELATKEAVTDGMKRALTGWGDQFGLVLYAKVDERQRIDRDAAAETSQRGPDLRVEGPKGPPPPDTWAEIHDRFTKVLGGSEADSAAAKFWLAEAITTKFGMPTADLNKNEKPLAFAMAAAAVIQLEEEHAAGLEFSVDVRGKVAANFAPRLNGVRLEGPQWRLGPGESEAGRPTWEEYVEAVELAKVAAGAGS